MAGGGEQQQHLVQPLRPRRAVVHRHLRVDDEHPRAGARSLARRTSDGCGGCWARSSASHLARNRSRFVTWWALKPLRGVGAGRRALVVDDDGGGLVDDLQPALAQREAEIGVLVVGGRVALVEAAELVPHARARTSRQAPEQ